MAKDELKPSSSSVQLSNTAVTASCQLQGPELKCFSWKRARLQRLAADMPARVVVTALLVVTRKVRSGRAVPITAMACERPSKFQQERSLRVLYSRVLLGHVKEVGHSGHTAQGG